ncbi:MAG: hypothetical protein ABIM21_06820 [candidate division WOR-3 bacterium]
MPGTNLLKETLHMFSEVSLIYVVNACKQLIKEEVPTDLDALMDKIEKLKLMGDLISKALEAMYAAEEIDMRDINNLDDRDL